MRGAWRGSLGRDEQVLVDRVAVGGLGDSNRVGSRAISAYPNREKTVVPAPCGAVGFPPPCDVA